MAHGSIVEVERGKDQADTERRVRRWMAVKSPQTKVFIDPRGNRIYLVFKGIHFSMIGVIPAEMYLETRGD